MFVATILVFIFLIIVFLINESKLVNSKYILASVIIFAILGSLINHIFFSDINRLLHMIAGVLLVISSITDIKDQTLPIEYYLTIVPVILLRAILIPETVFNITLAFDFGMILILIVTGVLFRNSFGFGDILLFITLTLLLGYEISLVLLMLGLVMTSIIGLGMVALRKAGSKTSLPFTPFILLAFTIYLLI